jgi:hypothetical protein
MQKKRFDLAAETGSLQGAVKRGLRGGGRACCTGRDNRRGRALIVLPDV